MKFKIKNGQIHNEALVLGVIKKMKDGDYEVVPYKKDRTTQQNRYLRGGVYKTIADEIGETTEYIHGVMGMKFLLDRTKKAPYVKSTASLNTAEFTEYVEKISQYVAGFGIYVPEANQFDILDF